MRIWKHVIGKIIKGPEDNSPRKGKSGHKKVLQIFERLFHEIDTPSAIYFWREKLGS